MSNNKKNKKNQNVAVAPQVDEITQTPAPEEVPVINVVEAKDLDPQAYAEAQASLQKTNGHAPEPIAQEEPKTDEPQQETPAAEESTATEPAKERVFHLRLNQQQIDMLHAFTSNAVFSKLTDGATGAFDATTDDVRAAWLVSMDGAVKATPYTQQQYVDLFKTLDEMCVRSKKAPAGNGNGTGYKIFGRYSPIAILNWMGHVGFGQYDAKNALRSLGVDTDEIAKTTWSRALAKGKKPDAKSNKVKIITDLTDEEELQLMEFFNLAAREAAEAATAKIEAAKAKVAAKLLTAPATK
jgi:hypothetical protein